MLQNLYLFNTSKKDTNVEYQVDIKYIDTSVKLNIITKCNNYTILYHYNTISEPVQERIIYWSFPRHESDICRYSSLSRVPAAVLSSSDDTVHNNLPDNQRSEYEQGLLVSSTSASSIVTSSRNIADETRDPRRQPDGSKGHKSQHPFYRGIKLLEQGCVHNVLQVGKFTYIY